MFVAAFEIESSPELARTHLFTKIKMFTYNQGKIASNADR